MVVPLKVLKCYSQSFRVLKCCRTLYSIVKIVHEYVYSSTSRFDLRSEEVIILTENLRTYRQPTQRRILYNREQQILSSKNNFHVHTDRQLCLISTVRF